VISPAAGVAAGNGDECVCNVSTAGTAKCRQLQ